MEFPPVSNLISATFDGLLNNKELTSTLKVPAQAPQPVANAEGMGSSDPLGSGSSASSGTNRVGTVLDTVA